MLGIALKTRPHAACIVPERREELTTEGGLDVARQHGPVGLVVSELKAAGIRVSLFIAPDPKQIEAAASVGAPVIEIHTGAWCEAVGERRPAIASVEFQRIKDGVTRARGLGLEVHAGHGLDYRTAEAISALPEIVELNIGHFLIGEALFGGLSDAIKTMRAAMERGRARLAPASPT
jgi:pyridoxine 5-phosphate synthase